MYRTFPGKTCLVCAAALAATLISIGSSGGQSQHASNNAAIEQELVHTEFGFFEAWKSKDVAYFRTHIPENGVFWSENGTLSRDEQLQEQQASAKNCTVEGYSLSDFGVLPLATGAFLLTYKAEQYATCGGQKLPVHRNGSSVYIFKQGRWEAIYRAAVPLKNQS
jgi:hypothetical protein